MYLWESKAEFTLLAASLPVYFIQWLLVHIITKEEQKVHFGQCVIKPLPRLEINKKKKKTQTKPDAPNGMNGTGACVRVEEGFERRRNRLGEGLGRRGLLRGPTQSPPQVASCLLPAQATPGTPFSQQLGSLQGRGGGTQYFLSSQSAGDRSSQPWRGCQKGWCYSRGRSAIFCAPRELFGIKITRN